MWVAKQVTTKITRSYPYDKLYPNIRETKRYIADGKTGKRK